MDENSAIDAIDWYADWDGDGFGSEETKYTACEAPSDYVDSVGDCNDLDPYINPAAQERCDTEIDDNCDGELNSQDAIDCIDVYMDGDGDGCAGTVGCFCDVTEEYFSTLLEDCADDNPWVNPDAEDDSPFVDQNCDGQPLDWSISAHEIEGAGSGYFGAVLDFEDANIDGYPDMIASDSNGGLGVLWSVDGSLKRTGCRFGTSGAMRTGLMMLMGTVLRILLIVSTTTIRINRLETFEYSMALL